MNTQWYFLQINELTKKFGTNLSHGLSKKQVEENTTTFGLNISKQSNRISLTKIFFSQFVDPLIYLLVVAATLIFIVGQSLDAFVILGILLFNAFIGTFQEYRTTHLLTKLSSFLETEAVVLRESKKQIISSKALVPGDIVYLQSGAQVPADIKLIEAYNLSVDESFLTGESHTITKNTEHNPSKNQSILEIKDIVFQGSYIATGQGIGIVVATGSNTQAGILQKTTTHINTQAPIKKDLQKLSHIILFFTISICTMLFGIGWLHGKTIAELFTMITALFICIVPEGLPVVMTLVMISGAYRMAKHSIIVKRLKALEALGRTNLIIVDKTGTLTKNEMFANAIWTQQGLTTITGSGYSLQGEVQATEKQKPLIHLFAQAAVFTNDTQVEHNTKTKQYSIKGDPTQAALFIFAQKYMHDITALEKEFIITDKQPFTSHDKYSLVTAQQNNQYNHYILGAPEVVMLQCHNTPQEAYNKLEDFLAHGLRVIALGHTITKEPTLHQKKPYEFIGFITITDTIRNNISTIIAETEQAGIHTIMATGDHGKTGKYIAKQVGLATEESTVITGQELQSLSDSEIYQALTKQTVFARLSPTDKLRLVQVAKNKNYIVTMTGDGINDVPALVAADVGIVMGTIGTEVTKQAADVILLHDSFENIIHGIKEGSSMFLALRRTILYFMASNMGEVLIIFFALICNIELPIIASQILWLNLITDGFLDMALSMEPNPNPSIAHIKKLPKKIIDSSMIYKMFYLSIPMGLISLGVFWHYKATDLALARTITLQTLAMFQWFNAWNCRSEDQSVFSLGFFANPWLILATTTVLLLQVAIVYLPSLNFIFKTTPLTVWHWIISIAAGSCALILEETRKFIAKHLFN